MNRHTIARSITTVLTLMPLAGCLFGGEQDATIDKVDDLVSRIERVHVETEVSKGVVRETVAALESLSSNDFGGNAAATYLEFMASIQRSEKQAARLRSTVGPMKDASDPVFEQWAKDLAGFASPRMRHLSEQRLATTRERYNSIVASVDPAQSSYEVFNQGLRDIALFLGHDFNPVAVAEIEQDIHAVANLASELDGRFNTCLMAARTYLDSSAIPAGPAGGASGAVPPQGPPPPGRN